MNEKNNLNPVLSASEQEEGFEVDILEIFRVLKNKLWLIVLAAIVFAGAVGIYSKFFVAPQYRARTSIYVDADYTEAEATLAISLATNIAQDYPYIIKSYSVMDEVSSRMGLGVSGASLVECVDVEMPKEAVRVLEIYVTYSSPEGAVQMANTIVDVFKKKAPEFAKYSRITISQIDNAQASSSPISLNATRNMMIAGVMGAVIVAIFVVAKNMISDKINSEEYLEKELGLNMITIIPEYAESPKKRT